MKLNINFKKVLVLSPHTDDAELGAGGTISRLLEEGKEVYYIVFSKCENSVPPGMPKDTLKRECQNSLKIMGIPAERLTFLDYQVRNFPEHRQKILEDITNYKTLYKPDLVLMPSSHDVHQDHQVICIEAIRAFKKESSMWGYEHPWNNLSFTTDIFVNLDQKHVETKIRALKEYKSQKQKAYMNEKNVLALAYMRGAELDLPYAEAFELIRFIY